ncbi:hypothetical protein GCM10010302_75220 [Streptomyces polychromogenes]|uniref:Uncharacterized protein n=1 Tax=Streptomyces polychromogenes TaxID=67342 RepID=A0ABN0W4R9_9ACTN
MTITLTRAAATTALLAAMLAAAAPAATADTRDTDRAGDTSLTLPKKEIQNIENGALITFHNRLNGTVIDLARGNKSY